MLLVGCGAAAPLGESGQLHGTAPSNLQGTETALPVRLSRAFFERSLTGNVRTVDADGRELSNTDSDVEWRERVERGPGDDHVSCAVFPRAGGARLCFRIMGDVSSVGVNEYEMYVTGVISLTGFRFVDAARLPAPGVPAQSLKVRYRASAPGGPVAVEFSLRQI